MQNPNYLAQHELRTELCRAHGLDPEQITFVGDSLSPVFDYEALSVLAMKLTDIRKIDCTTVSIVGEPFPYVTAKCEVEIPDGRIRSASASAVVGEELAFGARIASLFEAEAVAHARATRRGIRSVGINLVRAHRHWMQSGTPTPASGNRDPKLALYQEIHVLAAKLGLIAGADRSRYESLISANFDGRTSTRDLTERELDLFVSLLRLKEKNM